MNATRHPKRTVLVLGAVEGFAWCIALVSVLCQPGDVAMSLLAAFTYGHMVALGVCWIRAGGTRSPCIPILAILALFSANVAWMLHALGLIDVCALLVGWSGGLEGV